MCRYFLVAGLLLVSRVEAGFQFYEASLPDAGWEVEATALQCSLIHHIPGYGRVEFSRKSKGTLAFKVHVKQAAQQPDNAVLLSLPPEWKHYSNVKELGPVPVVVGTTPFYFSHHSAQRLLAELEEGMMPTLVYQDWADGSDEITVRISAINFSEAWKQFQDCQSGLLNYNFDDVRVTVVSFALNQTSLEVTERNHLERIVKMLKEDPSIKRVKIDGYTDSIGLSRINLRIAQRRADLVKSYFLKQGISAKRLFVQAHSETEAPFSNRTEEGRIKNRRVVVTLSK